MPIQPIVKGGHEYQFVVKDTSHQLGFVVASDLGADVAEVFFTFLTVDDCLEGLDLGTSGPSSTAHTQHGTISWSVAGLAAGEQATVSLAGLLSYAVSGQSFIEEADWPLSGDLLVAAGPSDGPPTSMIVRRNLRLTPGLTIPTIDLSSGESFRLQAGQITLTDVPNADWSWGDVYLTTAGAGIIDVNRSVTSGPTLPFMFLPSSQQAAGDLYMATYGYQSTAGAGRVTSWFHSPIGQQLVVPSIPSGARVWNSGNAGEVRLTAEWPVTQPGWIRSVDYTQGPDALHQKWWSVTVTPSYAGGNSGAVTIPDLRNVDGWKRQWELATGTATSWRVGSSSSVNQNPARSDGASETWAAQSGTITP